MYRNKTYGNTTQGAFLMINRTWVKKLVAGGSTQGNQLRKRNKSHSDWKGNNKLSLFADDMVLYIENLDKAFLSEYEKTSL